MTNGPPSHRLIANFMTASTPLEKYLHEHGPMTDLEIRSLSLTLDGLQTFFDSWMRNRAKQQKPSDVTVTEFEILRVLTDIDKPVLIPSVKRALKNNLALADKLIKDASPTKNPGALRRLGGLKGGKARASAKKKI
jgi:hypothetical protein